MCNNLAGQSLHPDHVLSPHKRTGRAFLRQASRRLHCIWLRAHGDLVPRRMVQAISKLLVQIPPPVNLKPLLTLSRAVPTPNVQCNAATNHLITNATLNLSSDVILLCIALPMFVRTQMPARKKVALCCVFGLGIFVMISAILNKYYSFTNPFGSQWTYWYCRESSTSMLVANLPFVYTLFRRMFNLRSLDSTAKYGTKSKTGRTTQTGGKGTLISRAMPEPETGLNNKFFTTTHITGPNAFDEKDSIEEKKSSEEASGIKKNVNVTFTSLPADSEHSFGEA